MYRAPKQLNYQVILIRPELRPSHCESKSFFSCTILLCNQTRIPIINERSRDYSSRYRSSIAGLLLLFFPQGNVCIISGYVQKGTLEKESNSGWVSELDNLMFFYSPVFHDSVHTCSTQIIFIVQTLCTQQQFEHPVVSLTCYNGNARNWARRKMNENF